jgi:hypothetical protein
MQSPLNAGRTANQAFALAGQILGDLLQAALDAGTGKSRMSALHQI